MNTYRHNVRRITSAPTQAYNNIVNMLAAIGITACLWFALFLYVTR